MKLNLTMVELQDVLGKLIRDLTDEREPYENKRRIAEQALTVSAVAKQMINNADVTLRSVKFMADYKLEDSAVKDMIGGNIVLLKKDNEGNFIGNG